MGFFYKSVADCQASKQHLLTPDENGNCFNCGEKTGEVSVAGDFIDHMAYVPALPDPKSVMEPLSINDLLSRVDEVCADALIPVTPAFEGTFAETESPKYPVFEPLPDQKYDDFIKFDIRTGTITLAEKIKKKDRLLHLEVYLGGVYGTRTIVAGIAEHFDPICLIGMQVVVVANLEPRKLGGFTSYGMILAGMGPTGLSLAGCMGVPDGTEIG